MSGLRGDGQLRSNEGKETDFGLGCRYVRAAENGSP